MRPLDNVVSWFRLGTEGTELSEPASGDEQVLRPGCAVAICTSGRPASVSRFLDSLAAQSVAPAALLIVDASVTEDTERLLRGRVDLGALARDIIYFRVTAALRGLPRQRNFALRWVPTDLVAFFDDDIVLRPSCLAELERVHRGRGDEIAGVAAPLINQAANPTLVVRVSRLLGMISTLQPGRYCRSGFAIPWEFCHDTTEFTEGEWLYGGATMWKTAIARRVGFYDGFNGYSLGEDLEFSLRARRHGKIGVASRAGALHLHDPSSRPDPFALGYMEIFNRFEIQRRGLPDRSRLDVLWFAYAWMIDTVFLLRDLRVRARQRATLRRIRGRVKGAYDVARGVGVPAT